MNTYTKLGRAADITDGAHLREMLTSNHAAAVGGRHLPFIKATFSVKRIGDFVNFYYAGMLYALVDMTGQMEPTSHCDLPPASFEVAARAWWVQYEQRMAVSA
jgi:hypothetical protein